MSARRRVRALGGTFVVGTVVASLFAGMVAPAMADAATPAVSQWTPVPWPDATDARLAVVDELNALRVSHGYSALTFDPWLSSDPVDGGLDGWAARNLLVEQGRVPGVWKDGSGDNLPAGCAPVQMRCGWVDAAQTWSNDVNKTPSAAGNVTTASLVDQFWSSQGHRWNLIMPGDEVAVGLVENAHGVSIAIAIEQSPALVASWANGYPTYPLNSADVPQDPMPIRWKDGIDMFGCSHGDHASPDGTETSAPQACSAESAPNTVRNDNPATFAGQPTTVRLPATSRARLAIRVHGVPDGTQAVLWSEDDNNVTFRKVQTVVVHGGKAVFLLHTRKGWMMNARVTVPLAQASTREILAYTPPVR